MLDEAVWERALVMGVNNEVRPGYNIPAPVETDMLLAYSETHFYVAFRAYDPDPSRSTPTSATTTGCGTTSGSSSA